MPPPSAPEKIAAEAAAPEPLRVVQIVASVEEEAAGPSYSVPGLARALAGAGCEVELMSLGPPGESERLGVPHLRFARALADLGPLARLGVSPSMRAALSARAARSHIFHTNGLWMMPNVYPAAFAKASGPSFVLSPRGMLDPAALQYSLAAKRAFWLLAQGRAARAVSMFHATSEREMEDIRACGLRQPVAIVPNGIDMPATAAAWRESRVVLSLGRIHPKKGLDILLRAWAGVEAEFPQWRLRIIGPDEGGHAGDLCGLAARLGLRHATVAGPLYGEEKQEMSAAAELFVLPTRGENFAMTVAASLAAGTPVISTKGAPWAGLVGNGCGWWVDHGPQAMEAALRAAMSLPTQEREWMGRRGAEWMARDFSWAGIGRQMAQAYAWLRHGGARPPFVRV